MVRGPCPSKDHFAKCETRVEGRPVKYTWKCDHCGDHVFAGPLFKSAYARIHLAADRTNGLISKLCKATDDHAESRKLQFRKLIKELDEEKKARTRKRKQQQMRMQEQIHAVAEALGKKKKVQPTLDDVLKVGVDVEADVAVAQWAIAHDIPANALKGPFWKTMNDKLSKVASTYKPVYPKKLKNILLPMLKKRVIQNQGVVLKHQPGAGRTLTGDGATKGVPLINFLVHVPGKGITLLEVTDCTKHMATGGVKDAMYVRVCLLCILLV